MVLVTNLLHQFLNYVRSEVLTTTLINNQDLWDVKVCSLIRVTDVFERHGTVIFRLKHSKKTLLNSCLSQDHFEYRMLL